MTPPRRTLLHTALVACFAITGLALGAALASADEHGHAGHTGHAAGASATDPGRTPSPPGAAAYFISPKHGEQVSSPVTVRFGLRGMGIAPATVEQPNTGHHHLIVDAPLPDVRVPIPADDHYRHFGGGQTEMTIELPPGKHTLQLLLGDFRHIPHDPPVISEPIEITVR